MKKRQLMLMMGIPLAVGSTLLAGCGQQPPQTTAGSGGSADSATTEETKTIKTTTAPTTRLEFSSKQGGATAGATDTWTLKVVDAKTGQPVKEFDADHDKLMHLVVVKSDLSWFNHLHPDHKGDGTFVVTTKLPSGGRYKIYADYTPKGGTQEAPQHEFVAEGTSRVSPKLTPDKMQGAWMTKKVMAHPEGEPDAKGGATYEVALMPMPMPIVAGQESMLHFQVRDAKGQPIKDLQPYLGALGHCVVLSQDAGKYLHAHPVAGGADHDMSKMGDRKETTLGKSGGPDVMFHTTFPEAGLYKAWGQFVHKGKVITAAFVLNAGAPRGEASDATAVEPGHEGHDHGPGSDPHAH